MTFSWAAIGYPSLKLSRSLAISQEGGGRRLRSIALAIEAVDGGFVVGLQLMSRIFNLAPDPCLIRFVKARPKNKVRGKASEHLLAAIFDDAGSITFQHNDLYVVEHRRSLHLMWFYECRWGDCSDYGQLDATTYAVFGRRSC